MNRSRYQIGAALIAFIAPVLLLIFTFNGVSGAPLERAPEHLNSSSLQPELLQPPLPLPNGGRAFGEQSKLQASDAAADDLFGWSVALDGDTALVGAIEVDINDQNGQGAVYVYVRSGGIWTEQAKLTASDGAAGDYFGGSLALEGDTALIGAAFDDTGANYDQGSVYVFVRSGGIWTEQAKLTASDGAAADYFGGSIALDGDTALIGAASSDSGGNSNQGAAYVFTRSESLWGEQAKLVSSDGAAADFFGISVALDGDTALIGASSDDVGENTEQGSATVFVRSEGIWAEQVKLTASNGKAGDYFGYPVALDGTTALIGATYDDIGTNEEQGSVYVFASDGITWTQQVKLTSLNGRSNDYFGEALALEGNTALIGSVRGNGAVHVFAGSGALWLEQQSLTASDGTGSDNFAKALAYSAGTTLVGAFSDQNDLLDQQDTGSVYLFIDPELLPTATPTLTPTLTSTPEFTETPTTETPAETPFPTEPTGEELLVDGGFETTSRSAALTSWVVKRSTNDKVKCNTLHKTVAISGNCAFVFKGSTDENSALLQAPDASGLLPSSGAVLHFSAYVNAHTGASGKIKVVVKYTDGDLPDKFSVNLIPTDGYQPVIGGTDLRAAAISKVKVQIKHSSQSGKVAIDEVSLRYVAGGVTSLIHLP